MVKNLSSDLQRLCQGFRCFLTVFDLPWMCTNGDNIDTHSHAPEVSIEDSAALSTGYNRLFVITGRFLRQFAALVYLELYRLCSDDHENNTKEEADRFLLCQSLAGDSTDDIPGINRVGLPTADKLLCKDATFENVINVYKNKKLTKEDAILTRRLVGLDQWSGPRRNKVRLFTF